MTYTCHSGGCPGADIAWEAFGEDYGVHTISYSFYGHNHRGRHPYIMTPEELQEGWERALMASETLKRPLSVRWPPHYVRNLLCRNWFQIKNSDSVYAIGMFESKWKDTVKGGTGWAVQMAIDCRDGRPIFFFDQDAESWYVYSTGSRRFIPNGVTPGLVTENFAGIGTRELSDAGMAAVESVYITTFLKSITI